MAEFLRFTLAAPMGSFGDLAGHERRGSGHWPGRSAILGLIGAAFGTRRDDTAGQSGLNQWQLAVGTLSDGVVLRDYHTVQTVPSTVKRPNSRPEALAEAKRRGTLNTVLTSRDYLTDCAFRVVAWGGDLTALAQALREPVFTPYLGRKSCPLAAPMDPSVIDAPDPVAALMAPDPAAAKLGLWPPIGRAPQRIASDPFPGLNGPTETRWDVPVDRRAWHFAPRRVTIVTPETI